MSESRTRVDLAGVPETLLWPLYCRAAESRRPDALISDPKSVAIADSIDYPFEEHFGRPHIALALRAMCFDDQIRKFLATHPDGTVVALGDGLETQFWRVDNGRVRWLSVDLEETMQVRRKYLPDTDRLRNLSCSALDEAWMDEVDPAAGLFISVQGLLMYLEEAEAWGLIRKCAERFPGAWLMFDAMPAWLTRQTSGGSWLDVLMMRGRKERTEDKYKLPPLRWGESVDRLRKRLFALHPAVAEVQDVGYPPGRGLTFRFLNPHMGSALPIRNLRPNNTLVRFAATDG
ncbi:class I SAM-dependent methyltransferase [Saccharopolyspora sp. WRP15-2]|uniref:Class I SAM-dependent methyltransferase n=1 Tax=Saccharopolyspora oryzae TaxID=2997343 RepID=A0ABT4V7A6_9PSEU|nr:class I SAM-dependent methyltransferase [Saccharopolyspora oryzae]MDA3629147.1 class I SAM-dependent methyltransferase [Saccharopolyspora oryzae]